MAGSTAKKIPLPENDTLEELASLGQSIWLDSIDRSLIESGELRRWIARGLRGLTSNPSIFEKAIARSDRYDSQIQALLAERDLEVRELFDELSVRDICDAADLFSHVYERSHKQAGQDGMVSLEVSPFLAHDAEGTVEEARRLWKKVSRPNLMIKVPGTPEGLIAFEKLLFEGINVNVTLLFSTEIYAQFAAAYLRALERRLSAGLPLDSITSVASFFVSRIDVEADRRIEHALSLTLDRNRREALESLLGHIAVANAQKAYAIFKSHFQGPSWEKLKNAGAKPQRLLWASTSTKNPQERDVRYIEQLIGADTVNTVPPNTLLAAEEHARIQDTLSNTAEDSIKTLECLAYLGISLKEITDKLLADGIQLFAQPFQSLMGTLECKRRLFLRPPLNSQELRLPILMETEIGRTLQHWKQDDRIRKLWDHDPHLWTQSGEENWLGWLTISEEQLGNKELQELTAEIALSGFRDAVVLGMGGSSLCAEVLTSIYEPTDRFPDLHVLDSTHPEHIRALESILDLKKTLFIVSSKSGSTLEPDLFLDYFFNLAEHELGVDEAGFHFVAVTDPGSALEKKASNLKFRKIFHGVKSIGGRYSALSNFGMVPAAALGMNTRDLSARASAMAHACSPNVAAEDNPGLVLGSVLGTLGAHGRDKITFICSPELWDFGAWLEQLLAESTGKIGKGLIPISDENIGSPEVYGADRLFVYLRLEGTRDQDLDHKVDALAEADFPIVDIRVQDSLSLVQEFYRWEFATAVAGSVLGINPFDQPDVEAAKGVAKRITSEYERSGSFPIEKPFFEDDDFAFYGDPRNSSDLLDSSGKTRTSADAILRAHLNRLCSGDYFAILAFLPCFMQVTHDLDDVFMNLRTHIRDAKKVATCLGFGPRYLHSIGQLHKGGPNSGVFLQITADIENEVQIPGKPYGFSVVNQAQARGDFEVLSRRGRRILRLHVKAKGAPQVAESLVRLLKKVLP